MDGLLRTWKETGDRLHTHLPVVVGRSIVGVIEHTSERNMSALWWVRLYGGKMDQMAVGHFLVDIRVEQ